MEKMHKREREASNKLEENNEQNQQTRTRKKTMKEEESGK